MNYEMGQAFTNIDISAGCGCNEEIEMKSRFGDADIGCEVYPHCTCTRDDGFWDSPRRACKDVADTDIIAGSKLKMVTTVGFKLMN